MPIRLVAIITVYTVYNAHSISKFLVYARYAAGDITTAVPAFFDPVTAAHRIPYTLEAVEYTINGDSVEMSLSLLREIYVFLTSLPKVEGKRPSLRLRPGPDFAVRRYYSSEGSVLPHLSY